MSVNEAVARVLLTLGRRMRVRSFGTTQCRLAKLLGVHQSTASRLLHDPRISFERILRMAQFVRCDIRIVIDGVTVAHVAPEDG